MPVFEAQSLTQALQQMADVREAWREEDGFGSVAYRGQPADFPLVPSIYRHRSRRQRESHAQLEERLYRAFRLRSPALLPVEPRSDLEWLGLMQHYGIPTRLLDWSSSPLAALFFALYKHAREPVVWMLNVRRFNERLLGEGDLERRGAEAISLYGPEAYVQAPASIRPERPIFVSMRYTHPRLIAQKGQFMVFGEDPRPLQEVAGDCLVQIRLDPARISKHLSDLFELGFTETSVFPDLDYLAMEITRTHALRA